MPLVYSSPERSTSSNIFANLYSPLTASSLPPPPPLEVFNNSFFQFKRDGFVLKIIKYSVDSEDVMQILDLFPFLLSIDVQSPQTDKLSTDTFKFIAGKYGDQLQSLTVSKFGRFRFTDALTAVIAQNCPSLKELRVNSYDLI